MSGGYFSCGNFMGEDKSGSAFFDMLDELEASIPAASFGDWDREVARPLNAMLEAQNPHDNIRIAIPPDLVFKLEPYVRRYHDALSKRLGNPDPLRAADIGRPKRGRGWRLYCAWDFLRAAEACRQSSRSVVLHFD